MNASGCKYNKYTKDQANNSFELVEMIETIIQEGNSRCIRLQVASNRKRLRTADHCQAYFTNAKEPFASEAFEQWVESVDEPVLIDGVKFQMPEESDVIRGTTKNKVVAFKNPYYIYGFRCVMNACRLYFWIYIIIQLAIAVYLGSCLDGVFDQNRLFWVLLIIIMKATIDSCIVAFHFGKHQDKLLAPALISTTTFAFPAVLLLITNEVARFIEL
jgi:hypothetical protein